MITEKLQVFFIVLILWCLKKNFKFMATKPFLKLTNNQSNKQAYQKTKCLFVGAHIFILNAAQRGNVTDQLHNILLHPALAHGS